MYRVILVDDEILVREAVSETMNWNSLGFELSGCFQHGREAIEFIRENPVDVVLTDICMPYVDGLELSRLISEEYPQICAVILSGYDNFEYAKQAMKYRVNQYLLKPFSSEELSGVLQDIRGKLDREWMEKKSHRKNKNLLESQLVMNFIYGKQTVEELRPELEACGLNLNHSHYLTAVLDTEIRDEDKPQSGLLRFAAYNIADEIVRKSRLGLVVQKLDDRIVILLTMDAPKTHRQEIERIFLSIRDAIERCMGLKAAIGIGSTVSRAEDLHLSYEEAEDMLEYLYTCGSGSVFSKEAVEAVVPFENWEEVQRQLNEAIKSGRKSRVETVLLDLFLKIRTSYLRKEWARDVIRNTLISTRSMLEALGMTNLEIYSQVNEAVRVSDSRKSLQEVKERMLVLYGTVTGAVAEMKDKKGNERAVLAVDYIRSHYMESTLNLQSVCDYTAMSSSRFCAMFKQCTGRSFIEVLSDVRMEKARELLETTDLKTYQTAELVGFSDPHYFSLAFKKATGMTPTEYAKEKRR